MQPFDIDALVQTFHALSKLYGKRKWNGKLWFGYINKSVVQKHNNKRLKLFICGFIYFVLLPP